MLQKKVIPEVERRFITVYPRALVSIYKNKPTSISDVQRDSHITYSHAQACIADLTRWNLVTRKKKGRTVILTTTDSGSNLASLLQRMFLIFDNIESKAVKAK